MWVWPPILPSLPDEDAQILDGPTGRGSLTVANESLIASPAAQAPCIGILADRIGGDKRCAKIGSCQCRAVIRLSPGHSAPAIANRRLAEQGQASVPWDLKNYRSTVCPLRDVAWQISGLLSAAEATRQIGTAGVQGHQANKLGLRGPAQQVSGNIRGMASTGKQEVAHSAPRSHQDARPGRSRWVRADTSTHTGPYTAVSLRPRHACGISRRCMWRWCFSPILQSQHRLWSNGESRLSRGRLVAGRLLDLTGHVPLIQLCTSGSQVKSLSHFGYVCRKTSLAYRRGNLTVGNENYESRAVKLGCAL